ncbi:MAG: hypothetical protein OXJ52_01955 [Oligoflexia bacterium]|nr:hypothetical protein [Oligoflexia bacterium]
MKFLKILPFFIVVVVSCGLGGELSLQERQGPYFWQAEKDGFSVS